MPVRESHFKPPLQPPVRHELGPGFVEKLQLRRPQMRPAFQLSGTLKVFTLQAGASQPVSTAGTAEPTFKSVYNKFLLTSMPYKYQNVSTHKNSGPDGERASIVDSESTAEGGARESESGSSDSELHNALVVGDVKE